MYLLQMHFKTVFDVSILPNASLERIVDELELADHVVGTLAQTDLHVNAQLLRDLTLTTRPRYVLLRELYPRHWVRHSARRTGRISSV